MIIEINKFALQDAIESVTLRGKYKNSSGAKVGRVSDTIVAMIKPNQLIIANASDTIAAECSIPINNEEEKLFMFDVDKVMKYLKTFKHEDCKMRITESALELQTPTQKAKVSLSIQHPGITAIAKLTETKIVDAEMPKFSKTEFETRLVLDGKELAQAIKDCGVVGNATYKINYTDEEMRITSLNFQHTEMYTVNVPLISSEGEDATVEFSAPIDKFCAGTMILYLSDESPLLLVGPSRKLIVAPYIRSN